MRRGAVSLLLKTMKTKNTKIVILAGGQGTRLAEETEIRPKPMVEIGGMPILWHIMKIYGHYGFNDFVICLGYRGYVIKEFFSNYFLHSSDVTFDLARNEMLVHSRRAEPWKVTLVDTGLRSMTGGRLARIRPHLEGCRKFMVTYGDGLADIDLEALLRFHDRAGAPATVTAVRPPGRFGSLALEGSQVKNFTEKPLGDGARVNGGFFVFTPEIFKHLKGDDTVLEQGPLKALVSKGRLSAYAHDGFWQPMDTLRDKNYLERLWNDGNAPWRVWDSKSGT